MMGLLEKLILMASMSAAPCFADKLGISDQTRLDRSILLSLGQLLDDDQIHAVLSHEIAEISSEAPLPWGLWHQENRSLSSQRINGFESSLQSILDQSLMNLSWLKTWREGVGIGLNPMDTNKLHPDEPFDVWQNLSNSLLVAELRLADNRLRGLASFPKQTLIIGQENGFYSLQADISSGFELGPHRHLFNLSFQNTTISHECDESLEAIRYSFAYDQLLNSDVGTKLEFLPQAGSSQLAIDLELSMMKIQMVALLLNSSDDINSLKVNAELSF